MATNKPSVWETDSKKLANAVVRHIRKNFKGKRCSPTITGSYHYRVRIAPKCAKSVKKHFLNLLDKGKRS